MEDWCLESGPGKFVRMCLGREKKGKKKENILANAYGLKPKWGERKGPKKKKNENRLK